ncbi:MAG: 4Fe-4S binding protein [Rhodoferax sp.]|nr:4Fe-4S binding protein [Rhodoferax sp.]
MKNLIAQLDSERCSGCGRCISVCPYQLFLFETRQWKKRAVLQDPDRCTGCQLCVAKCPVDALTLVARAKRSDLIK